MFSMLDVIEETGIVIADVSATANESLPAPPSIESKADH